MAVSCQPDEPEARLLVLPTEVLVELLQALTANDLARVDQLCHAFHTPAFGRTFSSEPGDRNQLCTPPAATRAQSVVEQALRRRAAAGGHTLPATLGSEATWAQMLLWHERCRRWSTAQVASGFRHSVFVNGNGEVLTLSLIHI